MIMVGAHVYKILELPYGNKIKKRVPLEYFIIPYKKKYIINKTNPQYLEEAGGVNTILNILL